MRRHFFLALSLILLPLSALALSGCSYRLDKETVPERFSQSLSKINSFSIRLSSDDPSDEKSQHLKWQGELDLTDLNDPKIEGTLELTENLQGHHLVLTFDLRHLAGTSYFRLSHMGLAQASPLMFAVRGQWHQLRENLPNQRAWLGSSPKAEWNEIDNRELRLFIQRERFFEVGEILGRETVEGVVSYHLRIELREEAFGNLAQRWAELSGQLIEPSAFVQLVERFTNKQIDLWLATRDFRPVKLLLQGTGSLDPYPLAKTRLEIVFSGYNIPVRVETPEEAEELLNQGLLKLLPFFSSS